MSRGSLKKGKMLIWRSLSRLCSLHTTCPCQTIISYFCRTSELARQYGSAARFGEMFPVFQCTRSHEHQSPKDLDYSLSDVAALANPSTAGWALLLPPGERNIVALSAMNHHDHPNICINSKRLNFTQGGRSIPQRIQHPI